MKFEQAKGAFIYDVRFLGRQVGQTASDFTKQAYVVKYLIRVGRQVKNTPNYFGFGPIPKPKPKFKSQS